MKKKIVALLCAIGTLASSVNAFAMGISTHCMNFEYDPMLEIVLSTETDYVRDEVLWQNVETTKGGTKAIPERQMNYIKDIDAAGIDMLLILDYGNSAYGDYADNEMPTKSDTEYYQGYMDYVRFMVSEVGEYVDAWEIWNEPDIDEWSTGGTSEAYSDLCVDASAIIKELDPTAKVVIGVFATESVDWAEEIFADLKTAYTDVNKTVDAFSIHSYSGDPEGTYRQAAGLNDNASSAEYPGYESVLKSYGFTGEVWITESGYSMYHSGDGVATITEDEQARLVLKHTIAYAEYLSTYGREGKNFWYTLQDGANYTNKEEAFGLFTRQYEDKLAAKAMRTFNKVTYGKTLKSFTTPQTGTKSSGLFGGTTTLYGELATYEGATGTTYVAYDKNESDSTTMTFTLSGDVAYAYNYLGELQNTYDPSTTSSITISITDAPVIIDCVTYTAGVDKANYYESTNTIRATGYYTVDNAETVELEVVKDGAVVQTETAIVTDGKFNQWFSADAEGELSIRVKGYDANTATVTIEETEEIAVPSFAAGTVVTYTEETNTVKVEGTIADYTENQYVTVLAVPEAADVDDLDMEAVGYIEQKLTTDGAFSFEFALPEYYETKTAIYLGGTNIDASTQGGTADIAENDYLYVASIDATAGSTLSATATVRNFASTERKAVIMIAQYAGTKLVDVKSKEITVPANTYAATAVSFDDVALDAEATMTKAFIWDSLDGIRPLTTADEAAISQATEE